MLLTQLPTHFLPTDLASMPKPTLSPGVFAFSLAYALLLALVGAVECGDEPAEPCPQNRAEDRGRFEGDDRLTCDKPHAVAFVCSVSSGGHRR
jgi:hypothetical protein